MACRWGGRGGGEGRGKKGSQSGPHLDQVRRAEPHGDSVQGQDISLHPCLLLEAGRGNDPPPLYQLTSGEKEGISRKQAGRGAG